LEKELSECTFTPRILEGATDETESGWDAGRRCTSRLYEDAGRRLESRGLTPPRGKCDCIGCHRRAAAGSRSGGGVSSALPDQRSRTATDRAWPMNVFISDAPSETGNSNLGFRSPISFDQFMQKSKSSADTRTGTVGRQRAAAGKSPIATSPSPAGGHLAPRVRLTFTPSLENLHLAETPRTPPLAASFAGSPTRPPSPQLLQPPRQAVRKTVVLNRSRPPFARAASTKWDDSSGPVRRPVVLPGKNFIQYDSDFGDIFALRGLRT